MEFLLTFFLFIGISTEDTIQKTPPTNEVNVEINEDKQENPKDIIHNIATEVNKDLTELEKGVESADGYLWWITEDNYNIQILNSPQLAFKHAVSDEFVSKYNFKSIVNYLNSKTTREIIEQTLLDDGFIKNEKNSSIDENDERLYDYISAYQKNDIICTFIVRSEIHSDEKNHSKYIWSQLIFSNELEEYYNKQKQILDDLNLKNKPVVISIKRQMDNFYYINVNYRRTGHYIIAQKINGKFEEIVGGQDYIPCTTAEEFNIPEYIYEKCF